MKEIASESHVKSKVKEPSFNCWYSSHNQYNARQHITVTPPYNTNKLSKVWQDFDLKCNWYQVNT
jgi:hypothetical protein